MDQAPRGQIRNYSDLKFNIFGCTNKGYGKWGIRFVTRDKKTHFAEDIFVTNSSLYKDTDSPYDTESAYYVAFLQSNDKFEKLKKKILYQLFSKRAQVTRKKSNSLHQFVVQEARVGLEADDEMVQHRGVHYLSHLDHPVRQSGPCRSRTGSGLCSGGCGP